MRNSRSHNIRYWFSAILSGILLSYCSDGTVTDTQPSKHERYNIEDLSLALELLAEKPDDVTLNQRVWSYYTETGRYEELFAHAVPVFRRSSNTPGKERLALMSGAYISQGYVLRENFDSVAYYLNRIMPLADGGYGNDLLNAMTHNIAALYYLKTELDYSSALEHYEAALDIMERKGETTNRSTILCNIASIYVSLRDVAGFEYAHAAYDINHSDQSGLRSYGRVFSTILLARMYYLEGDYSTAHAYADEAAVEVASFPQFVSGLDLLYADIALERADYSTAERYYLKALAGASDAEPSDIALGCLRYGMMLSRLSRYVEANKILNRGLALHTLEYRDQLLLALSDIAVRQGRDREALELYKEYHACLDSVSYIQRERAFRQNRLLAKDNELQSRELDLLKANRRIVPIVAGTILILIIAVTLWVVNRRQNRMYRHLVEVHQQSLTRLKGMRSLSGKDDGGVQEKDDRDLVLWRKLEDMMHSEHIYRHSDISLDRIAEMLGTNRSYVSRVINNYSGMSFYNYIHSRRIEEASQRLSDAPENISLKALAFELGYNSISSFYRAFLKETGVPPSRYFEEVVRIRQNATGNDK